MASDPVLVRIELNFRSTEDEDADALGDRIREAVSSIVGREALEDFRLRTLPLVEPKGKGGLRSRVTHVTAFSVRRALPSRPMNLLRRRPPPSSLVFFCLALVLSVAAAGLMGAYARRLQVTRPDVGAARRGGHGGRPPRPWIRPGCRRR